MSYFIIDFKETDKNAVAIEDSIMLKGQIVTAGSRILEGFTAPFDATVIKKLSESGMKIAGRCAMDEFGIFGIGSDADDEQATALEAVEKGAVKYALCNDLFGKYRSKAAKNNLAYLQPTYGTVSRFGLVQAASSMEQIGVLCKDLEEGFSLLSKIAGHDENDGAMFPYKSYDYNICEKNIKIAVPKNIIEKCDSDTQNAIKEFTASFDSVNIDIDNFDAANKVFTILATAEISHNINRYDGIKFGYRAAEFKGVEDLYTKTRTQGFGKKAKLAALLGSMLLDTEHYTSYYEKAMKVRRLIKESLTFDGYDLIILPCKIDGDDYENLRLYALALLAGLPSASFNYKGQGLQLIANIKDESAILKAWKAVLG